MKKAPQWLEKNFQVKLKPLDDRPFLVSLLVTFALMLVLLSGEASLSIAFESLLNKLERTLAYWPFLVAAGLIFTALFNEFLINQITDITQNLKWQIPPIFCLIVLINLISLSGNNIPEAIRWCLGLPIFLFVYVLRFAPLETIPAVSDALHRKYLVERLAEILRNPDSAPKRIAIEGSWGIGKTQFLRLLRAELLSSKKIYYHIAWVNPWRAQTPEQAWAAIAKAVDFALGNQPKFPLNWVNHPFLVSLLELLPGNKITPKLANFLANDVIRLPESEALQSINRKISSRIGKHGRLLVFVDDMERAGSEVIRSILPVIDRLGDLAQSLFIFAIDPNRVGEAFGEKFPSRPVTNGYLDKVFDLQIPLPEPDTTDIAALLQARADCEALPFLAAALPSLASHLPSNPRTALRFYEVAKSRERMFFGRYHRSEIPALPFFLCWLIEAEYPGFIDAIRIPVNRSMLSEICNAPFFHQTKPEEHKDFPTLITELSSKTGIAESGAASDRLRSHVLALCEILSSSLSWISGTSRILTVDWIVSGHTRLEQLTIPELQQLREKWQESSGKMKIGMMLSSAFGESDFTNHSVCGRQLLEAEMEEIFSICKSAYGAKDPKAVLDGVPERIRRIINHVHYSRTTAGSEDQLFFDNEFFEKWIEFFIEVPLNGAEEQIIADVNQSRIALNEELARSLPYEDALRSAWWKMNWRTRRPVSPVHKEEVEQHLNELKEILLSNGGSELLLMFSDGRIAAVNRSGISHNWPPKEFPNQGLQIFLDPASWISKGKEAWKAPLTKMVDAAESNQNIAAACVLIIESLVMHPASCAHCGNGHDEERKLITQIAGRYPAYFRMLWEGAMKLDRECRDFDRLIRQRREAEEMGLFEPKFLQEHFPLPHDL